MALVVFVRGINVGGHRRFRPAALAAEFRHLHAVNIGAAGTFVIRRKVTRTRLRAELARRLPFAAEIAVCDAREILDLISLDPFASVRVPPGAVRCVSVLSKRPPLSPSMPIVFPPASKWLLKILARKGRFVLGIYRRDMKVIGYLGSLDRLFGVPATTRNWNTITAVGKVLRHSDKDIR
jgi:uncharacterized protein (DUF1697 family)